MDRQTSSESLIFWTSAILISMSLHLCIAASLPLVLERDDKNTVITEFVIDALPGRTAVSVAPGNATVVGSSPGSDQFKALAPVNTAQEEARAVNAGTRPAAVTTRSPAPSLQAVAAGGGAEISRPESGQRVKAAAPSYSRAHKALPGATMSGNAPAQVLRPEPANGGRRVLKSAPDTVVAAVPPPPPAAEATGATGSTLVPDRSYAIATVGTADAVERLPPGGAASERLEPFRPVETKPPARAPQAAEPAASVVDRRLENAPPRLKADVLAPVESGADGLKSATAIGPETSEQGPEARVVRPTVPGGAKPVRAVEAVPVGKSNESAATAHGLAASANVSRADAVTPQAVLAPVTRAPVSGPGTEPSPRTMTAAIPRVAAPASTPADNGQQAAVFRYIRDYDGGGCFLLMPWRAGAGERALEAFAADLQRIDGFRNDFRSRFGQTVTARLSRVSSEQCRALSFVKSLANYPNFSIDIKLVNERIRSGSMVLGKVRNVGNRKLHLIVVDDDGIVQSLDGFLRPMDKSVVFSAPLMLVGGRVETAQLLVAIAVDEQLDSVVNMARQSAGSFYAALLEEIGLKAIAADIAVAPFMVE